MGKSQQGLTKGKSCLTNLVTFYDKLTGAVDAGQVVDIIYLDFSKAFGVIPQSLLVEKVMRCGLDSDLCGGRGLTDRLHPDGAGEPLLFKLAT